MNVLIMSFRWRRVMMHGKQILNKMIVCSCTLSLAKSLHLIEVVATSTRPPSSHCQVCAKVLALVYCISHTKLAWPWLHDTFYVVNTHCTTTTTRFYTCHSFHSLFYGHIYSLFVGLGLIFSSCWQTAFF